ncbi:hypothetical protein [Hahella sp. HN01]|uniref:hypothetical protein n=1 Tax=Hahella sp. HN01 TaxID=2847262 RepID=UPI001C1EC09A|nr:hypothetical protein [Hahella sp. HN01]MBU6952615.1 hypothetical protein [Hahella sp. HN01]
MQKLSRLVLPNLVSGIVSARRSAHDRLFESLSDLDFITRKIDNVGQSCTVELQILSEPPFFNLLAGEAHRFFLASVISKQRSFQQQENNAAWQVIEHYYAAYYAIHYLIRVSGIGLCNLDASSVSKIEQCCYGASSGINGTPVRGLYVIRYNADTQVITMKKPQARSGGSHVDAWKLWIEFIDRLMANSEQDMSEYASEALLLSLHKRFVQRSVGHFNPPILRGEINYQFKGGVWPFERSSANSIRSLKNSILAPLNSSLESLTPWEGLVENNKIIMELAVRTFDHAAENYPQSICRSLKNKYKKFLEYA